MKLTADERKALSFIALLLFVSAGLRIATEPEPPDLPVGVSTSFELAEHVQATRARVEEKERSERPLAEGERIDPNRAPVVELARLPRIGMGLAERIVASRDSHGPFREPSDLARVAGVGERTVERLTPYLEIRGTGRFGSSRRGVESVAPVRARSFGSSAEARTSGPVVDVNRADAAALATLPGVGPVLAARIIAHRDSAGPFRKPEDLLAVSGIGPSTLERVKDRVGL